MYWVYSLQFVVLLLLGQFSSFGATLVFPRHDVDSTQAFLQDKIAPVQVPLFRHDKQGLPKRHLFSRANSSEPTLYQPTSQEISTFMAISYYVPVTIGSQDFYLFLDTGSSDTWVVSNEFVCGIVSGFGSYNTTQDYCSFGNYYYPEESTTLQILNSDDRAFRVAYVDSSLAMGYIAQEVVEISALKMNQTIGIADFVAWRGDNITSGVLGLGIPGTMPSIEGHQAYDFLPKNSSQSNLPFDCHPVYNSFVENMIIQGLDPVFSVAIDRTENHKADAAVNKSPIAAGIITFGGVPDLPDVGLPYARAPINPWFRHQGICESDPKLIGYGIEIDGFAYPNRSAIPTTHAKYEAVIDTGASVNVFPADLAAIIASLYDPPARWPGLTGQLFRVPCNATAPELGVIINGIVLTINPKDMIKPIYYGNMDEVPNICSCGFIVTPYGSNSVILGAPFLRNVLATYDLGKLEMTFMKRFYDYT
ncbi:Rhizopuspepsin [Dactylella cylindrospora]|nr:Rhizopuspepsin [Dactylella cylindrospora]